MGKAYAIKNKEGKYFDYWADCMDDELLDVTCLYLEKEQAQKDIVDCRLKNCKVVEITITEGDLELQLDLLKSIVKLDHPEIEKVKHFESGLTVILDKCVESKEQENKQLKEQLAIREKALKSACKDIKGTGLFAITDEFESFEDNYIKNAEQELNKDN